MKMLISIFIILFISCTNQPSAGDTAPKNYDNERYTIRQEKIGDCNYIIATGHLYAQHGFGISIIHAEDCKNPIHRNK